MAKARPLLRWAGFLVVCVAVSFYCVGAQSGEEPAKTVKAPEKGRPDLIKIDTLAAYGKLELPPVTFFHDKHTEVLLKEKKTCETCHSVINGKLSLAFKRQPTTKPAAIKDIYHQYCIGCHLETAAKGKPSGPPDGLCRGCHNAEPTAGGQAGRRPGQGGALPPRGLQAGPGGCRRQGQLRPVATTNYDQKD